MQWQMGETLPKFGIDFIGHSTFSTLQIPVSKMVGRLGARLSQGRSSTSKCGQSQLLEKFIVTASMKNTDQQQANAASHSYGRHS